MVTDYGTAVLIPVGTLVKDDHDPVIPSMKHVQVVRLDQSAATCKAA